MFALMHCRFLIAVAMLDSASSKKQSDLHSNMQTDLQSNTGVSYDDSDSKTKGYLDEQGVVWELALSLLLGGAQR